jgi:transposase
VAACGYVVFAYLERLAAQGELIYQDDTAVRILPLMAENDHASAPERTGMYTTALVVKVGAQTLWLYDAGCAHAGEHLQALLTQRAIAQGPPLVMSEALASHEADDTRLSRCPCLAHGRCKCRALEEPLPAACRVVLDALAQVFDPDEEARARPLSAEERLAYHQAASPPSMEAPPGWLTTQGAARLVEPNSSLGQAIAYLLGHWEPLPRFLTVPGAPLDNHLAERALTLFMRQRKTSLFYRTEHSASMASGLTSLIATCLQAGVQACEYLVALQDHRAEVCAAPAAWLPWTSASRRASPAVTRRPSPAIWARSGSPCHNTMRSARADRGTRASAVCGHHVKRPCESRFMQSPCLCPS